MSKGIVKCKLTLGRERCLMGDIRQRSHFSPPLYLVLPFKMRSSEFRKKIFDVIKASISGLRGSEKVLSYVCSTISTEEFTTALQNIFKFLWCILSSFCPFTVISEISRQLSALFLGILWNTLTIYIISYHVAYTMSFSVLCYVYQ